MIDSFPPAEIIRELGKKVVELGFEGLEGLESGLFRQAGK